MPADTCMVCEGNMDRVGAHAHRRGCGLMRHGQLWKYSPAGIAACLQCHVAMIPLPGHPSQWAGPLGLRRNPPQEIYRQLMCVSSHNRSLSGYIHTCMESPVWGGRWCVCISSPNGVYKCTCGSHVLSSTWHTGPMVCVCLTWFYERLHRSVWEKACDPQLQRKEGRKSPKDLGFCKAARPT